VTADRPILSMTVDDWHKVLRVNLSGAFYMSKPALEHMIERGSGRIINISSIIGEIGNVGQANYAASKSGLFGFTKTLAREAAFALARAGKLSEDGVGLTVNAVTLGLIQSEMTAAVPAKVIDSLKAAIPLQRMGRPEEIVRVVSFLAADASAYIMGQVWGVTAASTCERSALAREGDEAMNRAALRLDDRARRRVDEVVARDGLELRGVLGDGRGAHSRDSSWSGLHPGSYVRTAVSPMCRGPDLAAGIGT
jgi:short-subunit dehydrogenase